MHDSNRFRSLCFLVLAAVGFTAAPEVRGLPGQAQERPATAPAWEVEVIYESPPASSHKFVTFEPIDFREDPKAIRQYMALARRELRRNPELVERAGLKYFYIVRDLRVSGQERGLTYDVPNSALYATGRGAHNTVYQRHCVHHEFFHYLMNEWRNAVIFDEPDWMALNPPGTRYGTGGKNARGSGEYELTHPAPGFINRYSQSSLREDMCEIFAALQVPEERRLVMQWAREDEVLRNKVKYMEALTARYLEEPPSTRPASRPTEPDSEHE